MKKNINEQIFKDYLFNHTPLFLEKELCNNSKNDEIVKHINDALIELKKDINREKKILKMKIQIK